MNKLIRYLKPFTLSIILIVIFLFAQAMTDLSLPDYMSKIVNVGLQQNGIEQAIPQQIRSEQFAHVLLLASPEEAAALNAAYAVLPADATRDILTYDPTVLSADEATALEASLSQTIMMVAAIDSGKFPGSDQIPAGISAWDALAKIPAAQKTAMLSAASDQIANISPTIQKTAATQWIATEYQAIGIDMSTIQNRYILNIGGLMLLIALLSVLFAIIVGYFSAKVAAGLAKDLRIRIFRKVESFANTEFDHFSTASLITRTTNDIQQIQMTMVMLLRILFFAPMMAIGGIIKILGGDVSMGWIIALAIVALLTLIGSMFAIALPKFKIIQALIDKLNLVTREILTGLMVNRAFNTQRKMQEKFASANKNLTDLNLFVSRAMVVMFPMMMLIMNFTTLAIVWVGGHQIDAGTMQVGDMMAFMQYGITIIFSFLMVSMVFIMMPRASVAAGRVIDVIETDLSILDPEKPVQLAQPVRGKIEFNDVIFRYPGADDAVLTNISFTAEPGQTTALIGSTGSGKSTLINLIPRFYDVSEGQILIDGVDIRHITQHDLREAIGYVPQKGILFTGDIASNIRYGHQEADDNDLKIAAQTAQVLDFIESSEDQFETVISQGGTNVSGGQKQRLSIARALAKKPPVFIFDDSFSALDYKTDAALRRALKDQTAESTVIIVAQRIGTIRNAEQIIVLDEGKIVGRGTHHELLEQCPVYAEIAASQLSAEEMTR
ncbi:MAG: ABC transporter ATP-binding protein [Eubacteriales bacterium]|nr:ABC transporter ATP-binding protein [Eubacteriales bacterium]